jgi:hypothetical protein
MRTSILALGALALFGVVQPASAQMCGGGQQQAQASTPGMMSGGMCGMMGKQADDPMADKPAPKQQQSGMCSCCRNMAMMRDGMGGGMHHDMPGMGEQPKQQQ